MAGGEIDFIVSSSPCTGAAGSNRANGSANGGGTGIHNPKSALFKDSVNIMQQLRLWYALHPDGGAIAGGSSKPITFGDSDDEDEGAGAGAS